MDATTINIAIADHHIPVREGIIEVLKLHQQFRVLFDASSETELLHKIANTNTLPDICIIDSDLFKTNGSGTARALQKFPAVKTLILFLHAPLSDFPRDTNHTANGYLHKHCKPSELKKALIEIYGGNFYCDESIRFPSSPKKDIITEKETEFLSYCCTELTYKEIAVKMNLSLRTVEGYRDLLFKKLEVVSRTGLVIYAIKKGIRSIEEEF